jgi:hypothetical protein
MQERDLFFVNPIYRLREVGATVGEYDEHFWRNGHSVPIVVFDDSSPANQDKYYSLLERTTTHNHVYYVGPREKEQFITYLNQNVTNSDWVCRNCAAVSLGRRMDYALPVFVLRTSG